MYYLKIPKILGTVKAKGRVGWIPLDAISFQPFSDWGFDDAGRVRQRLIREGDLNVSRQSDRSSKDIMHAYLNGSRYPEVKIVLGETPGKKGEGFLYTLTDVLLVSFSLSGEGGDPRETFVLNCKDFRIKALS